MQSGNLCHFTKLDGTVLDQWLPSEEVACLIDVSHPTRMQLLENLGAVSVEVGERQERELMPKDRPTLRHVS